jgi:hypothetical protein
VAVVVVVSAAAVVAVVVVVTVAVVVSVSVVQGKVGVLKVAEGERTGVAAQVWVMGLQLVVWEMEALTPDVAAKRRGQQAPACACADLALQAQVATAAVAAAGELVVVVRVAAVGRG